MNFKEDKTLKICSLIIAVLLLYSLVILTYNILRYHADFITVKFLFSRIVFIAGIISLIIYFASGFKNSLLFKIYLAFIVAAIPIDLFSYLKFIYTYYLNNSGGMRVNWLFYIGILQNLILIVCSIIALKQLSKKHVVKLNYYDIAGQANAEFETAPLLLRFLNRFLDILAILLLFATVVIDNYFFKNNYIFNEPVFLVLVEVLYLIYYYLILEGIFHVTIGKLITSTMVVNDSAEKPSFLQILGRTFSRFIPFEPFSFFSSSSRGWHDTITNTYVVEMINKDEEQQEDILNF